MNIKSFVKRLCPDAVLPLLKYPYHIAMRLVRPIRSRILCSRILSFLPYYQDELSRELLHDHVKYLRTGSLNILLDRAAMNRWHYTRLAAFPIVKHWEGRFDSGNYSGFVILSINNEDSVKYTCRLLELFGMSGKYRILTLKDFLDGAHIDASELVIASVSSSDTELVRQYAEKHSLQNDIARFIIGKHEEIQYLDVFEPVNNEVSIDAGAYIGDTALRFLKWGGEKIRHIYSFEFDPVNFAAYECNLQEFADKVTLVKKGTWDKNEAASININGSSSQVSGAGTTNVQLTAIDNVVGNEKVTFVKMDVEGAELKSLMGARNTIIKNHPRLAICAYHKREDLYELPKYILSIVPEYKFLLRRYDSHSGETVLYAYCDE